jgi:hypothetical protein
MRVTRSLLGTVMILKDPNPFLSGGVLSILLEPRKTERRTILHRNRIGLLAALGRLPFEETIDGHDAASEPIGIPEAGPVGNGLGLGIDRLPSTVWVLGPVRDQAPRQKIERAFVGSMVLRDDQQMLAAPL